MKAGAVGAYTALQETVAAFKRASSDKPKVDIPCPSRLSIYNGSTQVFIATSNLLGVTPPSIGMFGLGTQKHNLAYFVQGGNQAYNKDNFRFYLASQVNSEGKFPGNEFSGEAHATVYWNLIQRAERGGWDIRFIKDGSILEEN